MSLTGHLAFFKLARRFKSKLTRRKIKTVTINNLRHQIEFLVHRVKLTKHIKVYNIESGAGVDDLVQVEPILYSKLKEEPI